MISAIKNSLKDKFKNYINSFVNMYTAFLKVATFSKALQLNEVVVILKNYEFFDEKNIFIKLYFFGLILEKGQ